MNELNLFIMSPEDVVRWYKPQNEVESYLLNSISYILDADRSELKHLESKLDDLDCDNSDLEQHIEHLEECNQILRDENDDLEERISYLEDQIAKMEKP